MSTTTNANSNSSDEMVLLNVGGYKYTTKRGILLATHDKKEEAQRTYFCSLLSDCWNQKSDPKEGASLVVDIPDRDGDMFFYVLYYLRVGDLPRDVDKSKFESLLSNAERSTLMSEAGYYGLHGLEELCRVSMDKLKGFASVGDFDLSRYSDFSVNVDNELQTCSNDYYSYILRYKFDGDSPVEACVHYQCCSGSLRLRVDNGKGTTYVDKKTFEATFKHIQGVIVNMYGACDKSPKRKLPPRVSEVLAAVPTTMIPAEIRLWWAIEINEMIEFYEKNRSWDFEFGSEDKDLTNFLHYDRDWAVSESYDR